MTPKEFDIHTSKELTGNTAMRLIEDKARSDAEKGTYEPPPKVTGTYWDQVQDSARLMVYFQAYKKRKDRIDRMESLQT